MNQRKTRNTTNQPPHRMLPIQTNHLKTRQTSAKERNTGTCTWWVDILKIFKTTESTHSGGFSQREKRKTQTSFERASAVIRKSLVISPSEAASCARTVGGEKKSPGGTSALLGLHVSKVTQKSQHVFGWFSFPKKDQPRFRPTSAPKGVAGLFPGHSMRQSALALKSMGPNWRLCLVAEHRGRTYRGGATLVVLFYVIYLFVVCLAFFRV